MLFRRISDVNLKYIAIGLGPVVLGAAIFFKYRIERNFMNQGFYHATLAVAEGYAPLKRSLGSNLKYKKIDIGNAELNHTNGYQARVGLRQLDSGVVSWQMVASLAYTTTIPVSGQKGKGILHSWCSKEEKDEKWRVDKLDIEINQKARTIFIHPESRDIYDVTVQEEPKILETNE